MKFQPTRRTKILMAGVVLAGAAGAFVLWQNGQRQAELRTGQAEQPTAAAAPPEPTPVQRRALEQLQRHAGAPMGIVYSVQSSTPAGPALCGYAGPQATFDAPPGRRPARVFAFVSLPDRLATSAEPGFDQLLSSTCPNLVGARPPA